MESFSDVWPLVCDYCKNRMTDVAFKVWISPIEPKKLENDTVTVYVKTDFQKNIINEKYLKLLTDGFESVLGFGVGIDIFTEDDISLEPEPEPEPYPNTYEYTFDTFVVGSSNKFAHAAAGAVAANPGKAYNPLFIHGNSGLGKTHLLNAICYEIGRNHPSSNIIYTQGENFTNELVACLRENKMNEFHDKYRNADVLLMDDIQFIAGKTSTQEEFFHTFNTLTQAGKQIVLTSDRPPKEIQTLEERLLTRFEWGLIADIQPPDFETRMAIVKRKAKLLDFNIPDDVVQYIAEKIKNNIRQLEGTVRKLKAYYSIEGHEPSIIAAQIAIKDILSDNEPLPVTLDRILSQVSYTFGVTPEDILSASRTAVTSKARKIAIYVVREVTDMSMEAIGKEFGGRDHSTIIYSLTQVKRLIQKDPKIKATIADIIKNIEIKK